MKVLFTICGRAGSKGIKNKNIRDFIGKPLPYYTISAIDLFLKHTNLDLESDIVINSDSKELLTMIRCNPMRDIEIIVRSEELVGDSIGKIDVIRDCAVKMQERKNIAYDMVVDLDITSPLRTVKDIENIIMMHNRTGADVTTSVTTARRNPYFNQLKQTEHGFKKVIESNYTARQQAPEIFDMNASIYAYKPEFLFAGKSVLDGYVECCEMYDTGILDLDHGNDFELMEVVAKYLYKKNEEFSEVFNNF